MDKDLFNKFFNRTKIVDQVGEIISSTYDDWLEYRNNHDFFLGYIKPQTFDSVESYFTKRKFYNKYISRNDITFLRAYEKIPIEKFNTIDRIISISSDIAVNEMFSPPVFFYHNNEIHPGKFLAKACSILDKSLPVLVVKPKTKNLSNNSPVYLDKKLENLSDISAIYKGKIHMFFIKYNKTTYFQAFSLYNTWNKYDLNGWLAYPEYDFKRFWIELENVCNKGNKEISFYHPLLERNVNIMYSKKTSHIFKDFLLSDGYRFFNN
jgi:hypothetical protein